MNEKIKKIELIALEKQMEGTLRETIITLVSKLNEVIERLNAI